MRWVQGKASRLALLAHYVLVVTISARLHDHAHVAPQLHVAEAAEEHACCAQTRCPAGPTEPQIPCPSDRDHACPVCEFLVQKPMPVESDATWQPAVLVGELVWLAPIGVSQALLSPWPIRGPPAVA